MGKFRINWRNQSTQPVARFKGLLICVALSSWKCQHFPFVLLPLLVISIISV
jgi:hypothetical protein